MLGKIAYGAMIVAMLGVVQLASAPADLDPTAAAGAIGGVVCTHSERISTPCGDNPQHPSTCAQTYSACNMNGLQIMWICIENGASTDPCNMPVCLEHNDDKNDPNCDPPGT